MVKITSVFDPALYYPHAVPRHPLRLPEAFINRAFGVAIHFGWHPDAPSGTFTLRHAQGIFTPVRGIPKPLLEPRPLEREAEELIRILSTGTLPPPGNKREFFKEVANHQISDALERRDWKGAFQWAERCLQVLGTDRMHSGGVLNLRAKMVLLFGHQAEHVVLDARELTTPFFEGLIWTPEEAADVAKKLRMTDDLATIQRLIKLRQQLNRLQLIAHLLPLSEQKKLEPWLAVQSHLKLNVVVD